MKITFAGFLSSGDLNKANVSVSPPYGPRPMDYETLTAQFAPSKTGGLEVLLTSSSFQRRARRPFGLSSEETATLLRECPFTATGIWRNLDCECLEIHGAEELGGRLFQALFPDGLREILHQAWGRAVDRDGGLRLQLWLDLENPWVAGLGRLPWELLYDDQLKRFLQRGDRRWLLARALEGAEPCPPLAVSLPLRILVAMAGPADRPPLDFERERSTIDKALAGKAVQVEYLERATLKSLRTALLKTSPHVVHWIGHGDLDAEGRGGVLLFEGPGYAAVPTPGDLLAECLRDTYVRLAVLNGCETGRIPEDPLAGVATALVRAGLPAVVAMQRPILDASAIQFTEAFYERLAAGAPVDAALSEGRLALFTQDQESFEWAVPVLYLLPPDGRIFEIGQIELPTDLAEADHAAKTARSARASLPYPVERLLGWRPVGVPVGDVLAAVGCLHGGLFTALTSLVLAGRADVEPLWLFLLLAGLLPLSVGLAVASAWRRTGLRVPWLCLAAFAALLTLVFGFSR